MWLIFGILLGLGVMASAFMLRNKGITVRWYEWALGLLGLALALFTLQNYIGSTREFEPVAPGMFLLVFGVPALVLLLLAAGLPWLRINRKKKVTA